MFIIYMAKKRAIPPEISTGVRLGREQGLTQYNLANTPMFSGTLPGTSLAASPVPSVPSPVENEGHRSARSKVSEDFNTFLLQSAARLMEKPVP